MFVLAPSRSRSFRIPGLRLLTGCVCAHRTVSRITSCIFPSRSWSAISAFACTRRSSRSACLRRYRRLRAGSSRCSCRRGASGWPRCRRNSCWSCWTREKAERRARQKSDAGGNGRGGHEADGTCRTSNSGQSFLAARCNPKARELTRSTIAARQRGATARAAGPPNINRLWPKLSRKSCARALGCFSLVSPRANLRFSFRSQRRVLVFAWAARARCSWCRQCGPLCQSRDGCLS